MRSALRSQGEEDYLIQNNNSNGTHAQRHNKKLKVPQQVPHSFLGRQQILDTRNPLGDIKNKKKAVKKKFSGNIALWSLSARPVSGAVQKSDQHTEEDVVRVHKTGCANKHKKEKKAKNCELP